jgi:CRP-like cAMP-binding protein
MNAERLKGIVNKVPAFRDLALGHVHRLMQAGEITAITAGTTLCVEGDDSTDMFVLLSGELLVKSEDVELSFVDESDVIGEMSLITGQPRCATIEVVEDAMLFVIHKDDFERLMSENVELAARIYRNMLASLCTKLRQSNVHLISSRLGV